MSGITHLQEFQKPALRGLVESIVAEKNEVPTMGDQFLPDDRIFSNTFAYDIIKKSNHIAAMIGYGAEPPVVDRDAVASKMGELAKMGLKYIATEEELLALNQARSDAERNSLIEKMTVKGVDLIKALIRRVDVIKMETLTKGEFSYDKNGVKINVDFGIPNTNRKTLLSMDDWTKTDHDVIGDLLSWVEEYNTINHRDPEVIWISREIQALLLKNSVIVAEAGRSIDAGRVSIDELNSILGGYGLPPVQVVTNRKVTVKDIYTGEDEVIEFMPVNRLVMLSKGVGNFLYGPTVENDFQPGLVLNAYDKNEPIESVLRAVAAGFPLVESPSLIFHVDVFTPQP